METKVYIATYEGGPRDGSTERFAVTGYQGPPGFAIERIFLGDDGRGNPEDRVAHYYRGATEEWGEVTMKWVGMYPFDASQHPFPVRGEGAGHVAPIFSGNVPEGQEAAMVIPSEPDSEDDGGFNETLSKMSLFGRVCFALGIFAALPATILLLCIATVYMTAQVLFWRRPHEQ